MIREVFPLPTVLLLSGAMMCAAFYLYIYFTAEAPRKGTLEWIALYEKPHLCRKGLLHRLKWLDLLWSFVAALLSLGIFLGITACINPSLLQGMLLPLILSALPTVLCAVLAYLMGKLFSGKVLYSLLAAVFLTFCRILAPTRSEDAAFLLGAVLLLLTYFTGKGFAAWLSLILSGILLGLGASISPLNIFLLLPWLGTVLFSEILRFKREDAGIWHTILAPVVGVLAVLLTITVVNFPLHIVTDLRAALKTPGYYLWFWLQLVITVSANLLAETGQDPTMLLPAAALLPVGVIVAAHTARTQHALGVITLLWVSTGLAMAVLFPVTFPYFLSVLALCWLVTRIDVRGYKTAAWVTAAFPAGLSLIMILFAIWRYVL